MRHHGRNHAHRTYQNRDFDCATCFPLCNARCDQCVRLVSIEGGKTLRKRLAELGLSAGDEVRVVQRHGHGPLILAVKEDTRMAIGRGMAEKILVNTIKNL